MAIKKLNEFILNYPESQLIIDLKTHSKAWFYLNYSSITEKRYYKLINMYNIKPPHLKCSFYNNGINTIKVFEDCNIPEGFVKGRITNQKTTKGYKWYTNGVDNTLIQNGKPIPNGYYIGISTKGTTGYVFVNNGVDTLCVPKDKIPDGYIYKGKVDTSNYKKSAEKRKIYYYNNGKKEIKLKFDDPIPDGFVEGKLPKKTPQQRILERDKYYDNLGYIAIKNLSIKQRTAYQYYRDVEKFNFDSIVKDDVYTYINKSHLDMLNEYSKINHSYGTSYKEQSVYKYIKSIYDGEIITNCRSVLKDEYGYYEIDIYIPDKKIGIEFNGTYWHNSSIVGKNYHLHKSKLAEKLGVRLIHIYEYEWDDFNTQNKIKYMLNIALGKFDNKIYARQCEIKQITNKEAKVLNDKVHLQGHRNAQVTYGLFYKGELVQLMSFSKSKYNRNLKDTNSWEIIRGCPGSNNIVIGGVSKLFKHFIKDYNPNQIFSYCDFNKFDGRSYEAIGMKFIGYTGPDMKWVLPHNIVVNRQPHRHKELQEQAISKIYGSGSKKFIWTREEVDNNE